MDNMERDPGLVTLLTQISKALHRRTTEELLGMRLKAFMVLGHVRERGGVSQQELESAMLMDANTVVLLLNELEAAGFSIRRRDTTDRRRHLVEITKTGRIALERAEKARESLEEEMTSGLSDDERTTLRRLLAEVLEGLVRAAPEPAAKL
jgi:DNA-binding MarR family transcriptional regulator